MENGRDDTALDAVEIGRRVFVRMRAMNTTPNQSNTCYDA
jgi:hypothetical protein